MADKDGFDRLGDEFDQAGRMTATFERELSRLQATMGDTGREIGSLTTGFGSGLRRAFDGVVFDGMRLQDALKGIARNMADRKPVPRLEIALGDARAVAKERVVLVEALEQRARDRACRIFAGCGER